MGPRRQKARVAKRKAARKSTTNRRSTVKPFSRYNPKVTTNRLGLVGFPNNRVVKMRYADTELLTSTSGSLAVSTWRANSIFDPDFTGIGTQPLGYDQWAQFYNHYIVIGSKISCEVSWVSSGASAGPCVVGIILDDDGNLIPTDYLAIMEQGKSISMHINPSSANASRAINSSYSAKKFNNITDIKDNRDSLGASFGANPTDPAFFHLFAQSADLGSTNAIRFTLLIDFIVILGEPKELPVSS